MGILQEEIMSPKNVKIIPLNHGHLQMSKQKTNSKKHLWLKTSSDPRRSLLSAGHRSQRYRHECVRLTDLFLSASCRRGRLERQYLLYVLKVQHTHTSDCFLCVEEHHGLCWFIRVTPAPVCAAGSAV